jgi:MoaA/NifB/PqqE/SkfB family radical SAM enzyme
MLASSPRTPIYAPKNLKTVFCTSPWNSVTIEQDGFLYSCACSNWTNLAIGNLFDNSITEIFTKSAEIIEHRNNVLEGKYGWCSEKDCNLIGRLPKITTDNVFTEFKIDTTVHLPTNITMAIDYNCNLKCASCRLNSIFENVVNPRTEYILNDLSAAYKNFDRKTMVMLDGGGDVFVSKAYEEFLFSDKLPKCWQLEILTNGNLIPKRKEQIRKIANQIDLVTVSLDAATEETYAITRGGSWANVIKGIEILKELGIKIHLQFVLQAANYKELLLYKELANSYKVGYGVQKIDYRDHMPQSYWTNATLEDNPNIDYDLLKNHLTVLSADKKCNLDGGTRWLLAKL